MSSENNQSNKKGIIAIIVIGICLMAAVIRLLGLKGILLGGAIACAVWICAAVSQKRAKKVPTILMVILLVVAFLVPGGSSSSRDLINLLGKTESEIVKTYGEPTATSATTGDKSYANEGFSVATPGGAATMVFLKGGSKALCGVTIGDSPKDAQRAVEKAGGKSIGSKSAGTTAILSYETAEFILDINIVNGVVNSVDAYKK